MVCKRAPRVYDGRLVRVVPVSRDPLLRQLVGNACSRAGVHLIGRLPVDEYTIEHILPQNESLSPKWREALGPEWQRVQETWLHTLGNLTLSGAALEGAELHFARRVAGRERTTRKRCDENGEAQGPWVGPGTMRAFVFAKRYAYDHEALEIAPGDEGIRRHVFRLGAGRRVRGRVEDREGNPLAGRRVGILLPGLPFCCFEGSLVVTDERGAFTVDGLRDRGGQVAVYGGTGDTRWRADASGDDVVIVVRSSR